MITPSDVKIIEIPICYKETIKNNAKKASIGGRSHVRKASDRKKSLAEDQAVAQIGECGGSILLTGDVEGYLKAREARNKDPYSGDNGQDIHGVKNVDIKTSLMRVGNDPFKYRLFVRPGDRRKNWTYILALLDEEDLFKVRFVGWAKESDLPNNPYSGDKISWRGAYIIDAKNLRPVNELIDFLKNNKQFFKI